MMIRWLRKCDETCTSPGGNGRRIYGTEQEYLLERTEGRKESKRRARSAK
jgi:hypothetical protein